VAHRVAAHPPAGGRVKPALQALVAQWQRELRLLDWRLQVEYVRNLKAGNGAPVYGLCSPLVHSKTARIQIRDPDTPYGPNDPSVEEALIHELVHLHFAPLAGATPAEIAAEEQAVWAISETIARRGAGREAQMIARAMAARAQEISAVRRQGRIGMDFALFVAALRAALTAEDPKASIEALIAEVEKAAGGGEPAPAQEPPPEDPQKPPMQRPAPPPANARAAAAAPASRTPQPSNVVSREEFDRFRVESYLDRSATHLNEAQRSFAAGLSYDQAKQFVATVPAPASPGAAAPAERRSAPTVGGRGAAPGQRAMTAADPTSELVDRRMGLAPQNAQAVTIDPLTRKLSISALTPIGAQSEGGN
jgi:hypothetical protein